MKRQVSSKQDRTRQKLKLNEMEIISLTDKNFKVIVIKLSLNLLKEYKKLKDVKYGVKNIKHGGGHKNVEILECTPT